MIDVHQNLGFVETFFCGGSRVIDNRCKPSEHDLRSIWIFAYQLCGFYTEDEPSMEISSFC